MKRIIITGATGNLGHAVVDKMIAEGHHLIVTVTPGRAPVDFGSERVDVHPLDLTDEQSAQNFIDAVVEKHGTVDAALLLAGGYAGGDIDQTTGSDIRKMISLNFDTAFHIARPVFRRMVAQKGGGRIVLVGARPALLPKDGRKNIAYALSKSMLFKLAEMLNAEGEGHGVVTSVIVPSTIDSKANREGMPNADFSRWVKPGEIAETIAFLISAKASSLRQPVIKMYGGA